LNDRVLLTGATGFLGRYLADEFRTRGAIVLTAGRTSPDVVPEVMPDVPLDLAEPDSFVAAVAGVRPDLVVNCGAMSSMSLCQAKPTLALKVNGKSPQALADACGVRFVQLSTDVVFDGDAGPYHAASPPRPLSVYGMSKAAGESLEGDDWLVLRLPLLIGRSFDGRRGATDMLRQGVGAKEKLVLFLDEFRTPLHAADGARGIAHFALDRDAHGIRHIAGGERLSRWELCQRFCAASGIDEDEFRPGSSDDPRRPKDVSLTPDWQPDRDLDTALADC
jgi:dTDP-4-dehydrorhamnose reductase